MSLKTSQCSPNSPSRCRGSAEPPISSSPLFPHLEGQECQSDEASSVSLRLFIHGGRTDAYSASSFFLRHDKNDSQTLLSRGGIKAAPGGKVTMLLRSGNKVGRAISADIKAADSADTSFGITKVCAGLYISDYEAAKDASALKALNITHVINISGHKNAHQTLFKYLKIEQADGYEDITKHFDASNKFINSAFADGSCVLVHCKQGISRSASIILGFLIGHRARTCDSALKFLKEKYPKANPNYFFIRSIKAWVETRASSLRPYTHPSST